MFVELTYYKQGQRKDTHTHHMIVEDGTNPVTAARDYVNSLNADMASFQLPYVLLGAKEYHHPDPNKPENHNWEQKSSIVMRDAAGGYRLVKCTKCGITGRQYEQNVHVTLDAKYLPKRFKNCASVIKSDARAKLKKDGVML
tara:strand:- start:702 stop:1127 length:426 start_codon:yes stop_codon:yes gene_type:complete